MSNLTGKLTSKFDTEDKPKAWVEKRLQKGCWETPRIWSSREQIKGGGERVVYFATVWHKTPPLSPYGGRPIGRHEFNK